MAQAAAAIPQVTRAPARRRHESLVDVLLLAPGLGYLLVFMCVPLVQVALRGFGLLAIGEPSQFTLGVYREVLANKIDRDSIVFSLYFALGTTVISLILSLVVSALLQVNFPGRYIISVLYTIPLAVPSLVTAFLVLPIIDR